MRVGIQGLPASLDAERAVLGSILLDGEAFASTIADLRPEDFSLDKHRRILRRAADLYGREQKVDRVTLATELQLHGELEQVGGLSYLVSLDDGLPLLPSIDSYVGILKEKAARRRVLFACSNLTARIESGHTLAEVVAEAEKFFASIRTSTRGVRGVSEVPLVRDCGGADVEYLIQPVLPKGAVVALTGDSGAGKSTYAFSLARDAGVPALALDRENPLSAVLERMRRLGMVDGPNLRVWGGWLEDEAPLPSSPIVADWVKSCEPRPLILVDSLSAFFSGDQNDAAEMRAFMHGCRKLADLGATVVVIHHDGKAETSKDYRGSSDFKAALDQAFHVSNFGSSGQLDKLVLRCFKSRFGFSGEISYEYAGGRFIRANEAVAKQTASEQLEAILRLNPGVGARKLDSLAAARGLTRNQTRTFLADGILAGRIRLERGGNNVRRHFLVVENHAENDLD